MEGGDCGSGTGADRTWGSLGLSSWLANEGQRSSKFLLILPTSTLSCCCGPSSFSTVLAPRQASRGLREWLLASLRHCPHLGLPWALEDQVGQEGQSRRFLQRREGICRWTH